MKSGVWKLVKYGAVGGASVVMYLLLYEVMRRAVGLGVTASVIAAYLPTLAATFLVQSRFTFQSRDMRLRTIGKYLVSMGTSLGVVVVTVWIVHGMLGFSELTANIVACLTSPLVGFLLQNFWVFRKEPTGQM